MEIDYSVIIRTIGKADKKYQKLLDSINQLEPKPKEVIIVLPEGYDLPIQRLNSQIKERFIFCEKGMVNQRMVGINNCNTEYMLVCDDDVSFDYDFVQKLVQPLKDNLADFSIGPLLSFLPPKGIKSFINAMTSSAVETIFNKDMYVKVLRSSGWSYNRKIDTSIKKYYYTQSAAWTCFFARTSSMHNIHFDEEKWLDMNGYASMDDSVMFYKAWLMGYKTIMVSDAVYEHLDAKTSTRGISEKVVYASAFNQFIFWYRFIYETENNFFMKMLNIISFLYYKSTTEIYRYLNVLLKSKDKKELSISKQGFRDALKYIKSDEFKQLEKISVDIL